MATTVGAFSAIDDTEVDAESPITESLVTRLRDNSYWIIEGTSKTTSTDTTKVLKPDGSGGIEWASGGIESGTATSGLTAGTYFVHGRKSFSVTAGGGSLATSPALTISGTTVASFNITAGLSDSYAATFVLSGSLLVTVTGTGTITTNADSVSWLKVG